MADEIFSAPALKTIGRGVVVQRPAAEATAPAIGPMGGVSVGAAHMPTVGGVMHVAIHHPDGDTLAMTMGVDGFHAFALAMNTALTELESGLHNRPEAAN